MPLVRISLRRGKPQAYRQAVADGVYRAMVEAFDMPANGRLQILTEHDGPELIVDSGYAGVHRSNDLIVIQITATNTRTPEKKSRFYARLFELLRDNPGVLPSDLVVSVVDVPKESWFFGAAA